MVVWHGKEAVGEDVDVAAALAAGGCGKRSVELLPDAVAAVSWEINLQPQYLLDTQHSNLMYGDCDHCSIVWQQFQRKLYPSAFPAAAVAAAAVAACCSFYVCDQQMQPLVEDN